MRRQRRVLARSSLLVGLFLSVSLAAGPPTLRGQEAFRFLDGVEHYRLPNGLEVVLMPDSSRDAVAVEFWTHAGTRDEPVGKFGLAHFFEHVMPYGPLLRSRAVEPLLDSLRTGSNARTRYDFTRYYKETVPAGTRLFLAQAAGRLGSDPVLDLTPARVESQRQRVLAEMERFVHTPHGEPIRNRIARGTFGAGHPYGHAAYGTPDETHRITRDGLIRWQRANVRPEYTTVFVAGDFEPDLVRPHITALFGRFPGGERPPLAEPRVPKALGGRDSVAIPTGENLLFLAWPISPWVAEETAMLELFGTALGARLEASRPEEVSASGVEVSGFELAGSFTIRAAHTSSTEAAEVERWVRGALAGALSGLTAEEAVAAREARRSEVAGRAEQLGWIGSRIGLVGRSLLFAGVPNQFRTRLAWQMAATRDQVLAAARSRLDAPAYVLIVAGSTDAP